VRIAHLSDLHVLSLEGAVPFRLFNKRITGYVNLRLKRGSQHKPFAVEAIAREIRRQGVEQVVITGDVTNLALEVEFDRVRHLLLEDLGLPPDRVSMVPGNHDVYTRGAHRTRRFFRYFEACLRSDLPGLAAPELGGVFPFVRLRGPVALIGLSTALPRPPLMASGSLGDPQLRALERILAHPEVRARTPVILQHHPWHNPPSRAKTLFEGLWDADAEGLALRDVERGLLLHGHLHRRVHRQLRTARGLIDAIGATSASLVHESEERMAAFNVYEIDDDGVIVGLGSHRLDPGSGAFHEVAIPRA
jgi:3',5'-cyclic AMP phosphodiesterase CpdA